MFISTDRRDEMQKDLGDIPSDAFSRRITDPSLKNSKSFSVFSTAQFLFLSFFVFSRVHHLGQGESHFSFFLFLHDDLVNRPFATALLRRLSLRRRDRVILGRISGVIPVRLLRVVVVIQNVGALMRRAAHQSRILVRSSAAAEGAVLRLLMQMRRSDVRIVRRQRSLHRAVAGGPIGRELSDSVSCMIDDVDGLGDVRSVGQIGRHYGLDVVGVNAVELRVGEVDIVGGVVGGIRMRMTLAVRGVVVIIGRRSVHLRLFLLAIALALATSTATAEN